MNQVQEPKELIQYKNTDILLLGENHTDDRFREYIRRQLSDFNPDHICVESCPTRFDMHKNDDVKSSVGVTAASNYVKDEDGILYLIDQSQREVLENIQYGGLPTKDRLPDDSIHQRQPLQVDFSVVREHKNNLKDSSPARWQAHNKARSEYMSSLILDVINRDVDSLAIITGLTHTVELFDMFEDGLTGETAPYLSEDRIRN